MVGCVVVRVIIIVVHVVDQVKSVVGRPILSHKDLLPPTVHAMVVKVVVLIVIVVMVLVRWPVPHVVEQVVNTFRGVCRGRVAMKDLFESNSRGSSVGTKLKQFFSCNPSMDMDGFGGLIHTPRDF
jgi:hypothetical protein